MQILQRLRQRFSGKTSLLGQVPAELVRARQLIAAIDAGGIPLDPGRIVRIAEDLGLEVSRKEHTNTTIERIRAAVQRC